MGRSYILKLILLVLLLSDLAWSYLQYYHQPLDGDLVALVLPDDRNAPILEAPFGFKAVFEGERYAGTNRYISHKSLSSYFKTIPLWLQHWVSPIDSLYHSAALIKLLVHISLIVALSSFVVPAARWRSTSFLFYLLFFSVLLQAYGYYDTIGVISGAPTYLFFYGLPITLFLYFLLPFYKLYELSHYKWSWWTYLSITFLACCLPFSSPLVAPLALLGIPGILFALRKKLIWGQALLLIGLWLLCGYSFYLGRYNVENQQVLAYSEALKRMGNATVFLMTSKLGLPLLLICLIGNAGLLWRKGALLQEHRWLYWGMGAILLVYLFALPLGGYRDYRPNILRHDTLMPVTITLFWLLGLSIKQLFTLLQGQGQKVYGIAVGIFLLIFTLADFNGLNVNACERNLLEQLSKSTGDVVELPATCAVLAWGVTIAPEQSETAGKMLHYWGVVDREVRFVQKGEGND